MDRNRQLTEEETQPKNTPKAFPFLSNQRNVIGNKKIFI